MKKWLWCLLGAACAMLMFYGGYQAYGILAEDARSDAVQREAVAQAAVAAMPPVVLPGVPEQAATDEPAPERAPISIDFDGLRAVNPDVVGWLYCEDTPINYPVVQGDDNSYYLRHLFNGESNRSGTLFLDWRSRPDFTDDQSVIYGHHMRKGTMFACLVGYRDPSYYEAHPVLYLLTPECDYRLEVFSGYVCEPTAEEIPLWFDSPADRQAYVEEAAERSDFVSDVEVEDLDRIITLSTCTYEFRDARYLVHTVLRKLD